LFPFAIITLLAGVIDPSILGFIPTVLNQLPPALVTLLPPTFIDVSQFPPTFIDVDLLPPALVDVARLPPARVMPHPIAMVTPVAPEEAAAEAPIADVFVAPAADVELAPTPATFIDFSPPPATNIKLSPAPAADIVVTPATLVGLDPFANFLITDDSPIATCFYLDIRATSLVPIAGLLDIRITILGQTFLVGETRFDLASTGILLLTALRLLVADLVNALGLATLY